MVLRDPHALRQWGGGGRRTLPGASEVFFAPSLLQGPNTHTDPQAAGLTHSARLKSLRRLNGLRPVWAELKVEGCLEEVALVQVR